MTEGAEKIDRIGMTSPDNGASGLAFSRSAILGRAYPPPRPPNRRIDAIDLQLPWPVALRWTRPQAPHGNWLGQDKRFNV